jgi:ferritin-like metal-binding protein YciE
MAKERESLQKLYVEQLRDLYSAEEQILEALPKMVKVTKHAELKRAFQEHYQQTEQQKQRLEKLGELLGEDLHGHRCKGMEGLLKEGDEMMKEFNDSDVLDAGLIAAAQRVEHYEMAGYGCARTFAQQLGHENAAKLLQQTLDEEKAADEKLTEIAMQSVNEEAEIGA